MKASRRSRLSERDLDEMISLGLLERRLENGDVELRAPNRKWLLLLLCNSASHILDALSDLAASARLLEDVTSRALGRPQKARIQGAGSKTKRLISATRTMRKA
jgi:hypothetical protein